MPENRFGRRLELIDQVKIVCDKNIGFVHFLSISTTIKVVNTLRTEPPWADKHVNYGKDRCAYIPKSQQTATQAAQAAAARSRRSPRAQARTRSRRRSGRTYRSRQTRSRASRVGRTSIGRCS